MEFHDFFHGYVKNMVQLPGIVQNQEVE